MRVAIAVLALLALGACRQPDPGQEPVARVNGQSITRAHFESEARQEIALQLAGREQVRPGMEQRIRESVLRRMVDDAVVGQKAAALGVTVEDAEVESRFRSFRERFADARAMEEHLSRIRVSPEGMKAQMRRDIVRERVAERLAGPLQVTEAELAEHYRRNLGRFVDKERVRVLRIVVRVPPASGPDEREKARARAHALRARAARPVADFAALARRESQAPEAAAGGDPGWIERGAVSEEFDRIVFALAPGAVSPVIPTRAGFEIVRLIEKAPRRERPLADVRGDIERELREARLGERTGAVLERLRRESRVEQLFLL